MMKYLSLIGLLLVALAETSPLEDKLATIKNRYIVVLKDDVNVDAFASRLKVDVNSVMGKFDVVRRYYIALKGFAVEMDQTALNIAKTIPGVKYIEEDAIGTVDSVPSSWGLDRIDQRDLPLDQAFDIQGDGADVNVYVLDTGIRETHEDFGGRAVKGIDYVQDGWNGADCHGHGTHCAGTAAGGIYGIARKANIIAVRLFDCSGFGTLTDTIEAIDHVTETAKMPAVMSMSFRFLRRLSLDEAVARAVASGIVAVAGAGNEDMNACLFSPAAEPAAITVGATDRYDVRASFSNLGPCVDIFAPGVDITSASSASDNATAIWSGTSMSTPHVAGVVAVHLGNGVLAPDIRTILLQDATPNKIYNTGNYTPNKLLYLN